MENMTVPDLEQHVKDGSTVILCCQAWGEKPTEYQNDWKDGHYMVVVGMDDNNIYVMDPSTEARYNWLPITELESRWHDIDNGTPRYGIAVIISGS